MSPSDNKFLMVKDNKGNMVPISNFITPKKSNAIAVITRYNNFPAVKIGGNQADGYSSGQALDALEEVAKETLPNGYGYAFAESSAQEREASGKTVYALALGMLFVFLSLAALYESWKSRSPSSLVSLQASSVPASVPLPSTCITTFTSRSVF